MPRYGTQDACSLCGHDVEYHGSKVGWIDRGAGRACLPYEGRDKEIVHPPEGQKHTVKEQR